MRSQMVVPGADGREVFFEIVGHARFFEPTQDLLLEREEEALDAPVLPRAVRGRALLADAQQPKAKPEETRSEDRLVVGAQAGRLSEALEGVEQATEDADRGAIAQGGEREAEPGAVVEQAEDGPRALRAGEKGEIQGPDQVLGHLWWFVVLELLAQPENFFLVFPDQLGDKGLADGLAAVGVEEVEGVGDLACAIGHQGLEPEDFFAHPCGLRPLEAMTLCRR